ncbi:MAG: shikimate 5-dehydrogenase [Betaproteobacteria bacterium]|nr:shikimate 5-dehydrogenase [Betaproteobacteria bacterium]
MSDCYAVVGNPVGHSLSPEIHAAFARQTGQDIEYVKLLAPLDAFTAVVNKFRSDGGKGINVTVPFKFDAFRMCEPAPSAVAAGAVNTLDFRGDKVEGFNTDGIGLIADLERNLGFSLRDKRVLVMGAGGATYGVVQPILDACPQSLVIANRTVHKATELVARYTLSSKATQVTAVGYPDLATAQFDLIINATSAGLRDEMPPLPQAVFGPDALAYDMVYGRQTPFLTFAQAHGARTADGLGMLVEQAAAAFKIWRGVEPQTRPVITKLRAGR